MLDEQVGKRRGAELRFNKGIAGRGAGVPEAARAMLTAYARRFRVDLGNDGMHYLFGEAC